uniref:RNA-dependent RNA polymerase n=1 Tax=Bird's-foot trefoil enamovirus 1 TaxID=2283314 RepID=A0A9Y0T781_9VIRU|nr:TPA_asm: RNA-dependent RNA polymerase [Bird's-foot trefoil enamovirus 1]
MASQAITLFLSLAFICLWLLPYSGAHPALSGTRPDVGCSPSLGGTLYSVDPPAYCDVFASMPQDLGSVLQSPSFERETTEQSPSSPTGPYQILSTWTWPNWTCSASKCRLSIYFPSLTAIQSDLDRLLAEMDLLSMSQACSDLLAKAPGYILRFAGETIIGCAVLIELLLVSWNAWLFSLVLYVLRVIPGKVAFFCFVGLVVSWVWPKWIASLLLQVTAFPLTSIRYWHKTARGLLSRTFSLIWSILTIWSSLPWLILTKMTRTLVMSSRVFSRRPVKKVSTKSFKAKKKMATAIKKKIGKKSSKGESSEERTIPGVQIKMLQEEPPAGVILQCTDLFGDHVGYATAVKLEGGRSGILLPHHVWLDSVYVAGPNGKMKFTDFTFHEYMCPQHDSLILTSIIAGWGAKLGARPRPLTTMDAVRLTRYSLFIQRSGKWLVQAAKVVAVGPQGMFRVISETAPGDSGLPLFDAKLNVALIHRGAWPNDQFLENRAVSVLPVPGLTCPSSPKYKIDESYFELDSALTLAEKSGKYEDGDEIIVQTSKGTTKAWIQGDRYLALDLDAFDRDRQAKGKTVWADLVDDEKAPKRSGNRGAPVDSGSTKSSREGRGIGPCQDHDSSTQRKRRKEAAPAEVRDDPRAEESRQPQAEEGGQGQTPSPQEECLPGPSNCHPSSDAGDGGSRRQSGYKGEATSIEALFEGFYRWCEPAEMAEGFQKVGTCPFTVYKSPPKGLSSWGQRQSAASTYLSGCCERYAWPETGAEAELSSLRYQAARRAAAQTTACIPPEDVRRELIKRTTEAYASTALPAPLWARTLDEAHMRSEFMDCVRKLKSQAGSGVPYASFKSRKTNGNWVYSHASCDELWETVRARLLRLLDRDFLDPVQAIQEGLVDPIRLFVKSEPHKMEKIRNKRYRLIASVSIVDQMVARMLFREQNEEELLQHMAIPSKPGLGFSHDEQVLSFTRSVAKLANCTPEDLVDNWSMHLTPTDCSGFDWSVPMWLLEDDLAVRNELTLELPQSLRKMRETWLKCLGQSVFCLSNGLLLAQTSPGIQKSGSFNTSSTNSRMRYMLALYAGASWAVTMGDDALEDVSSDLTQYARLGIKCERAEEFDFCSHLFRAPHAVVPKNLEKMVYGLLSGFSPESKNLADRLAWLDALQSILEEMRHMPREYVDMLIEQLGVGDLVER